LVFVGYQLSAIGDHTMPAIAQSVSWWCFVPAKLTPNEFVRAVADAGYLAVDLVPPRLDFELMNELFAIAPDTWFRGPEYGATGSGDR
jgi:hypothetical protein